MPAFYLVGLQLRCEFFLKKRDYLIFKGESERYLW